MVDDVTTGGLSSFKGATEAGGLREDAGRGNG